METTTAAPVTPSRILNIDQVCELLGFKKSYVYKLTAASILPFSRPLGKVLFFDREKIEEWALSNAHSSSKEKKQAAATHVTTTR